mmetsp:Transcript_19365/g.42258  ORF Transcript_19365/g.42258 Transcript_19365/m.42258 type:complete len:229 (+) Transcript_19365:58-744(+)
MAITESKIHSNLNRDKLFSDAWWLQYCFCCGRAIGSVGEPFCGGEARNLCFHTSCELTNIADPLCSGVTVECCITQQFQLPPTTGSPICVCFNKTLAPGKEGTDKWKAPLFDWNQNFGDTFWIYYLFCMGCGLNGIKAKGRPLCGSIEKCCCIAQGTQCETDFCKDGVWCTGLSSMLCCWSHHQFPPATGNPGFACCGFKTNKTAGGAQGGSAPKPFSYGKPNQMVIP